MPLAKPNLVSNNPVNLTLIIREDGEKNPVNQKSLVFSKSILLKTSKQVLACDIIFLKEALMGEFW